MSPLPPPVSNRSDDDGDETQVEESEQTVNASRIRVTPTYAPLIDHHRAQIIDIMRRKTEAIKVQEELENSCIFHLDWSAGNPKDPYTVTLDEPQTRNEDQSSEEDSALKRQTAELVKTFFGAPTPPRDDMWSMPMFFGDWITNNTKETRVFIEIQIKRVSGADSDLMKRCRIASRDVWLPLADPVSPEPLLPTSTIGDTGAGRPGASIPHSKPTSIFGDRIAKAPTGSDLQAITQIISETGLGKRPLDATSTEPDSTNPPVDKAEPSLVNSTNDGEPSSTQHKVPNSPRPPRRKLPNSPAADSTSKLPNFPVANSPSWGSNISNHGSLAASNGESEEDDETDNAATKADKAFAKSFPMVESLLALETTLRLQRKQNMERLMKEPDFRRLKENSFIYCVRVVALPGKLSNTNGLTGPGSAHRHATLLASGGWIVPPLEDRMKWRNDNKENRPASDRAIKKAKGCRAPPVTFDWSGSAPPSIHGEPCPVWRELAEPCLEDVYWMVWQLLAGKQYVGFSGGTKFGRGSASIIDTGLLDQCPFKSPSREALQI
ncbi:hypothetical protein QBC37DRAFT_275043 [Rhypophila decipiens]|uniref:Uncharacterized protein n=1 Tax=Rhypophila decipiens TaxID=261697 RepID=A0AAN6YH26_9PEZI|nr:hypothetical protein QBC37DRAFT_275043 [Rhypophila decipiens]